MRLARRTTIWSVVAVVGLVIITAMGLDRVYPPNLMRLRSHSAMVLAADGSILRAFASASGAWRFPVGPNAVDPKLVTYLTTYEDRRFFWHPGVDPLALLRAVTQAAMAGKVVSGASTLTMQAVRLLEPRPRTVLAKFAEMARALQLEAHYSKQQILGMYLTLAPYGGNLEGVRAASLAYFGKEPTHLSEAEAALLVALPQAPEAQRPDRFQANAVAARAKVLARLLGEGVIDQAAYAAALSEPAPTGRYPALNDAPHLALRLRLETPGDQTIQATIDHALQLRVQDLVRRRQATLEPGATIAVLAVANSGRKVIAYVGSGDFFDWRRFGQNDMVRAIRSPGSTLKPIIYGMAFDDLIAHPETMMKDVPMRFGDYAPENFDHLFRGDITAREALQLSLNLPAVALLDQVGPNRFAQRLNDIGTPLHLPKDEARPGLPIALGGVGVNLEELVTMFAALADNGIARSLKLRGDAASDTGKPLVSPVAAYYLTAILENTPPPPRWLAAGNRKNAANVAYKTGTSYGYRDAWAIGYNTGYTVGVWVGRPDGTFSSGRMGRVAAAPILFEIFDQLPFAESALATPVPKGVIAGGTNDLPANLRRFEARPSLESAFAPEVLDGPAIKNPVDGATVDLASRERSLVLQADGGALPLRWMVNGAPIDSLPYRRQAEWLPDGKGAAHVTVIDRFGRSASAQVWLK